MLGTLFPTWGYARSTQHISMASDQAELARRMTIWSGLRSLSDREGTHTPSTIQDLRIHRGQRGIYRDLDHTGRVAADDVGVAVGVMHTGTSYPDDLDPEGIIYHYPVTKHPTTDRREIESTRACRDLGLPLFVVTPGSTKDTRDVHLGWVVDEDLADGLFLILFSEAPLAMGSPPATEEAPFSIREQRKVSTTRTKKRPGQIRFRFSVLKRYGACCAACGVAVPALVEAAHIVPVSRNGPDDPRNGIVLCRTHHRAFDLRLLRINPDTLEFVPGDKTDLDALGVSQRAISGLKALPHEDALRYAWSSVSDSSAEQL